MVSNKMSYTWWASYSFIVQSNTYEDWTPYLKQDVADVIFLIF